MMNPPDNYLKVFLDKHKGERWVIIWEDLWYHRKEIIKSRLISFCGLSKRIHGRECTVVSLSNSKAAAFLDSNHLMGHTSSKYYYGLRHNGKLAAVATFGRSVPASRESGEVLSHELIRFCHRKNYHVSGGLSKLLKYFQAHEHPEDIFTSVDREWSDGSGYEHIGFKKIGETSPYCFYVDNDLIRHHAADKGVRICNAGNIRMALTLQ